MLIGGSNSSNAIYSITTTFDGVGILGTVTLLTEYLPGWKCVTGLALAGDVLAICVDGIIHYHTLFDNVTHIVSTSDMVPVSSNTTNMAFITENVLFCEGHCVKMFGSGKVSIISGSVDAEGDADGSAAKLCQPLGICVEFDHNMYTANSKKVVLCKP